MAQKLVVNGKENGDPRIARIMVWIRSRVVKSNGARQEILNHSAWVGCELKVVLEI